MVYLDVSSCIMTERKYKTFIYEDDVKERPAPSLNFDVKIKIRATDLILIYQSKKQQRFMRAKAKKYSKNLANQL